ncbi:hypothetical protein CCHOA_08725 [Corynebacterium choanae]|uniref:Uncharacterized protein n=1 Tax=Corynebacterium choanae TaxID=1862358 RepID=A0A3G6J8M9_9CORY|nr:hypothetical protein CCHOA_08725 [Corynebacterium choanae]
MPQRFFRMLFIRPPNDESPVICSQRKIPSAAITEKLVATLPLIDIAQDLLAPVVKFRGPPGRK